MVSRAKSNWRKIFSVPDGVEEYDLGEGVWISDKGIFKKDPLSGPMPQIWKLQRPLFTNAVIPTILCYNEDRSAEMGIPWSKDWADIFGLRDKVFAIGTWDPIGQKLDLTHIITDQGW